MSYYLMFVIGKFTGNSVGNNRKKKLVLNLRPILNILQKNKFIHSK